ncbi:MAG: metallophosphoesterase [Rhodothermaceae bacterium]|nr:metallophosphoesterase [Rhodothermaceae bacterium]
MTLRLYCLALLFLGFAHSTRGQALPFSDNFDDGNFAGWTIFDDREPQSGPSNWIIEQGALKQTSNIWAFAPVELETRYHLGTHVSSGNLAWTDYSFNAHVRSTDNDGVGLLFRYNDENNYYRILLMNDPAWSGMDINGTSVNTPLQRIQKFVDGEPTILAENLVDQAYPSGFFSLTADIRGDTIRAYLNEELILTAIDNTYSSGKVGMLSYANVGVYYDDILVSEDRVVYESLEGIPITYPVLEERAPYVQNPTKSSIEIAWRSVEPYRGTVQFGTEKGLLQNSVTEDSSTQKHHVVLESLTPSTRYFYSVSDESDEIYAEESTRTARRDEESQFAFLVLGDSGVGTDTQRKVAGQMETSMNQREVDFMIHVGDVHQGSGDYYDNVYFKPYKNLLKNINAFTSLGNHDVITDNGAVYLDDFYLPTNNPDSTERYYSFRWANSYFICLDTNSDYSPGSSQHAFLLDALNSEERQSAMWTFIYAHHPPFTEYWTNYYGDENVQNHLVPLYESYGVDMVMNGHTHSYERGEKEHVHYLVSGGGGGGLDDFFIDYDHISFSRAVHHFTRIDVDGAQLTVQAIDENGQQVDRFIINKFTDVSVDLLSDKPETFELGPPSPNPVNSTTTIQYHIPQDAHATLDVYDLLGRRVMSLVDRFHYIGSYTATVDVSSFPAGRYLFVLNTNGQRKSQQVTIVK